MSADPETHAARDDPPALLRVAVPVPLHRHFDYLPPEGTDPRALPPGVRLRVPFGRGTRLGLLVGITTTSSVPANRLRRAQACLDAEPVLDRQLLSLLRWAADYYKQPPGEMIWGALPAALRRGAAIAAPTTGWQLTARGPGVDPAALARRAPRQAEMLARLATAPLPAGGLDDARRRALRELERHGLAERCELAATRQHACWNAPAPGPALTDDQAAALQALDTAGQEFRVQLLFGITGSGKTEIYLRAISEQMRAGRQTLLLVPEIGLTPQLIERLRTRLGDVLVVMHSGLGERERLAAWRRAHEGSAAVVLGTRSALFAPLARPGMIILDEEHDPSFRQQEGVRYSARDLAVVRARDLDIPLVLGSATPSLETLRHALTDHYGLIRLPNRAGGGSLPRLRLVDLDHHARQQGLSTPLLQAMRRHLAAGGQVLLFLNRRGFAPALWCEACGHIVECRRCDARMTLHQGDHRLRCHHCGSERPPPAACTVCSTPLVPVGQGTERVEETLERLFPDMPRVRIDRDSVRRRGELEARLEAVHRGEVRILIGTQMLAKGHDFPDVSLVGVLDADQGLFASDFRASERLAQTVIQVAGRAGRAARTGEVLIQTRFPEHPLLRQLVDEGYEGFARVLLAERESAGWPPYARLALVHAEAVSRAAPLQFLQAAREQVTAAAARHGVSLLGPAPAGMERRAGRYRQQLLLQADDHRRLQQVLGPLLALLPELPGARRVRWNIDVDPADLL